MKDEKKKITDEMITSLLYKLTIISYIKQGEKLYCDGDLNIFVDNSFMPSFSRYFYNQNRSITSKILTDIIVQFAKENCQGRIVSILEGGYNLNALNEAVELHIKSLN